MTDHLHRIDALRAQLATLRPLPAEALRKLEEAMCIEYTYDSNRIEGNTLVAEAVESALARYISFVQV